MKTNIFLLIGLIGLMGILSGCEKDETRVIMLENPVPPSLDVVPGMSFQRSIANEMIMFSGTKVDPGFAASVTYFLEAAPAGTNFAMPLQLHSGVRPDSITFRVSALNSLLLRRFPADHTSQIDFRLRAALVIDAGTGALGTGTNPLQYISAARTADVTLYGLPRLDLLDSGRDQYIESPAGDGVYSGYVKIHPNNPFILKNPDTNTQYGGAGGVLAVNGSGIVPPSPDGYYYITVNTNNNTYVLEEYRVGLVGSATPNGWDKPDQKMDYNSENGTWYITIDLIGGDIKFRKNDDWAWNLGGAPGNLTQGGADIPITAGNYTITLSINGDTGTCAIVKN